jgi:signal transduction histidine kinase
MTFKYRLEGLDAHWVEAGGRRVAYYSYLPPGDYRFEVLACNNDGVWNEAGASLAITVLPHVWQTGWFMTVCFAAGTGGLVGTGWGIARGRARRRLAKMKEAAAVERERTRIARDIHDDLGTSLTRVSVMADSETASQQDAAGMRASLAAIRTVVFDMTRAMDEIVWAINPRHDTLESMVHYLGDYAEQFLTAAGLRLRLDIPLQLPAWSMPAEMRHHLFLAFKEALNNIARHASARQVQLTLQIEPRQFRLVVRDDGRGWPAEPGQASAGNGLGNMRSRMAQLGGVCQVTSAPGQGTAVEFVLPRPSDAGGGGTDET